LHRSDDRGTDIGSNAVDRLMRPVALSATTQAQEDQSTDTLKSTSTTGPPIRELAAAFLG
jgi:hypothetical protein